MSEYWVSRDKFYCKYCNIYIADDKPSRTLHDTGLRHKGNYDRAIRDMYKKGERDTKEKAEEAREMARINAAAHAAMTADNLAAGITPTEAPPPPPRRSRPVPSSSDPFSNYSTAESLGFVDPDAEANAAALLKQQSEGSIGQWEKVVKPPPLPPGPAPSLDAPIDESVAGETDEMVYRPSTFGREKVAAFDDDAYDPSLIALKLKRKRLTIAEEEESTEVAKVVKKEMRRVKEEERRKREESERIERGESKSGWNEVVKEEGYVLLFEEVIAKTEEGEETQVKEEVKEEDKDEKPVVEVVKAVFKKRRPNGVKQ